MTSIGRDAFLFCDGLKNVEIPSSVTSIGNFAFDEGSENLIIHCPAGSEAEIYVKSHGIKYDNNMKENN